MFAEASRRKRSAKSVKTMYNPQKLNIYNLFDHKKTINLMFKIFKT